MKSNRAGGRARRLALIAVPIVLGVLGLVAVGLSFAVFPGPLPAHRKVTRTSAMELRRAAQTWRGGHAGDECPTPERLRDEKFVDPASKLTDAWGTPFAIECDPDETIVISLGPDRRASEDDVIVPEGARGRAQPPAVQAPGSRIRAPGFGLQDSG